MNREMPSCVNNTFSIRFSWLKLTHIFISLSSSQRGNRDFEKKKKTKKLNHLEILEASKDPKSNLNHSEMKTPNKKYIESERLPIAEKKRKNTRRSQSQ